MDSNNKENNDYQHYFGKEHKLLRAALRDFMKKEVQPNIEEWEEQGTFPRELYNKLGELGFIGVGFAEEVGGTPGDIFMIFVVIEEIIRGGSSGIGASFGTYSLALPPIIKHGTDYQKEKYVRPSLAGEKITALAITEPSGGSDVANLKTTAVREGDHYIVNGSKTFITSGVRADQITCAVRTGGRGHFGISLLIIEADTPGYAVSNSLKKIGWLTSDTAEIFFDDCRVPVENLIGQENKGFEYIMENFQEERLLMAINANMVSQLALEESIKYVKKREVFGKKLKGFQVIKHKLADMATLVEISREFTYRVAAKMSAGEKQVKEVSMAKNFACQVSDKVTYEAVQIFGGYGLMRGHLVERLYRDNRILSIAAGTTEIMKEIVSNNIL